MREFSPIENELKTKLQKNETNYTTKICKKKKYGTQKANKTNKENCFDNKQGKTMKKISSLWDDLKSTFWFIPVLTIASAIAIAFILLSIDSNTQIAQLLGKHLSVDSSNSARSILSTIAATMIGVAGTVFSIILVVLTLTISQFGPRLVKNFMYDRINQVVLGSYISTFTYCLIILNSIKDNGTLFIPTLSIIFAIILAITNIILLIIFIHHTVTSMQAENVISNISTNLEKNLETIFPNTKTNKTKRSTKPKEEKSKNKYKIKQSIFSTKSGYLKYINIDRLLDLSTEKDILIEIKHSPGEYIIKNTELVTIYTDKIIKESEIENNFSIGKNRSEQQDSKHSIRQMTEIASRALSPGINDPYTAISCIDHLTSSISLLSNQNFPTHYHLDENNEIRIIINKIPTYGEMLNVAFNQIREFAKDNPFIIIRIMESLKAINNINKNPANKKAIEKHVKITLNIAQKNFQEENELKTIKEKAKEILTSKKDK